MVIRLVMLTWIGVGIYAAIVLQSGAVYALAGVIVGVALVPFVAWRHAPFAPARVKRVSLARGTAQIWVRDSDFYDALAAEVDTRVDA